MTADKMREDFERINNVQIHERHKEGFYIFGTLQDKWINWQKAYKAATEQSTAKIAELQGRIDELVEALELLRDNQNGCPLPKYQESFNEAMRLTDEALSHVRKAK